MRKEYYNYVVKLPVLLHELFRGKVADYHFSDMTVVMNHLVKSYIRMTDGGRVSTATRRILLCMDRIPDMSFFFRRQEKAVLFFEMDPAVADSLLEFCDQYKCTKNEKEHLLDYLCTIRVKRVIKEINDLKINKKKQHSHADRHQQPQAVK